MSSDTQNPGGWPDAARPGYPQNPERAEVERLRAEVHTLSTTCGHCGDLERAWAEAGRLRGTLTWVLNDVQAWCDAIAENGAGWDYWDDYYKSFKWGGIEKARAALAMKEPGHE